MWNELALGFQTGNYYLWAITILSFLALTIIFERIIAIYFIYNINSTNFLNNLRKMIASKDFERAMVFCRNYSKTSLPKIALAAVEASEINPNSVKGTIEEQTADFIPKIESRIALLPMLSALITLIGVLGTIDAIWWAFHSVDVLNTAKKQALIGRQIAEALNPTALALLASLLTIFGNQVVKSLACNVIDKVNHGTVVLCNLLAPHTPIAQSFTGFKAKASTNPKKETEEASSTTSEEPQGGTTDESAQEETKDEEEII